MSKCMGCMKEKGESEVCPHCGYVSPKEQENAAYLPEGTVLQNRYLLGRVLGQGGFGITYIGYDNTLDARVAIKEYYPGDIAQRTPGDKTVTPYTQASADYEHGKKRFIEEARTLARFSDFPGIVSVKDCFEEDNTAYMVMQFLEGIDLKEYLNRKGGKISPEEAVSILTPVMDALKEIHRAGIIHRDISPDNIFVTTEGQIKLIDFGAARQSLGGGKSLSIQLKPGYAPEEQYRTHGNQGPWTDVYALAATLYRMVTGQVPPEAMERLSYDTLEIPQGLPENIMTALQIGLAVRAPERYSSAEQFQNALSGVAYTAPVTPTEKPENPIGPGGGNPPPPPPKQDGNKKLISALIISGTALICVVLIAVAAAFALNGGNSPVNDVVNSITDTISPDPTPLPTPAPTPVPTPEPEHTYRVVTGHVTWTQAEQAARSAGGYLATINDAEEYNKIVTLLSQSSYGNLRNVWIGAYVSGSFSGSQSIIDAWNSPSMTWITGEPFTYTNWRSGEPSGYDANLGEYECYLQLFRPAADGGVWSFNDAGADLSTYRSGRLGYIIEFEG